MGDAVPVVVTNQTRGAFARKPVRVERVFASGFRRTRPFILERYLQGLDECTDLLQVVQHCQQAQTALEALNIFDQVQVGIEKGEAKQGVQVMVNVEEKNVQQSSLSAHIESAGFVGGGKVSLVNALGAAETLEALAEFGQETHARASLTMPALLVKSATMRLDAFHDLLNDLLLSSFKQRRTGGSLTLSDFSGRHSLTYTAALRDVMPKRREATSSEATTAFDASPEIVREALPSMLSSVEYKYSRDTRDSVAAPTRGGFVQAAAEYAGLGGDVHFVRGQLDVQVAAALMPTLFGVPGPALSLSGTVGSVVPLGEDRQRGTRIVDRLFLGGPTLLRGFAERGAGPRASATAAGVPGGDALGGDVRAVATAVLHFPLPLGWLSEYLRGHVFATAGNLVPFHDVKRMHHTIRAAVGAGVFLVVPILGRVEFNLCHAVAQQPCDRPKRLQWGFGIGFP